jgi:Tol biopolymer transport system component
MTFSGAPRSDITVAAADGSGASIAVPAPAAGVFYSSPVWGPGASLYVLHTGQESGTVIRQIERVDLTSGRRDIVLREAGEFDVSPDGRFLALMRLGGANPGLVLIDLASGQETMLVPSRGYEVMSVPRFDPTSQIVLFAAASFGVSESMPVGEVKAAHGSPQDLYTVSVQGGPASRLAALSLDEPIGSYSPDGARLAILSAEYLALMPSSGGEVQILVSPGTYGSVDWAP